MRAFLDFVCVPLCFVLSSEGRKEGVHHLMKELLRLRSFNALISFLACELGGDVELLENSPFLLFVGRTGTDDACVFFLRHEPPTQSTSTSKTASSSREPSDIVESAGL